MGGFYHGSVSSDSYVILAGGGYKSVSDFLLSQDHYKTSPGAGTAGTSTATSGSTLSVPYITVNANGHVTAYGTRTHTISGFLTAQDHYKTSVTAGTAGTSTATSGSTLSVPYVTINANGHVTGYGTHTHTITGFLTTHQSFSTFDNYHNTSENSHQLKITIGSTTRYCGPEWLNKYTGVDFGASGLQYMDLYGSDTGRGTASTNGTPTDDWYHIIRMNHSNTGGYFVDIATCFHSWDMWYRRVTNGINNGWIRILDSENSSVSGGGSSWDNSITVKINGTSKTLTIPSNPNTWRKVQLNGIDRLGTGTSTNPLNIKAGTGISITESSGTFTFNCTSDVYWKDVKDKIRHTNEFNIVPSGYNGTMWFNYRSDADTSVTVSEYIFGNGNSSASASIKAGTIYPGANASYDIGKTDSRWNRGYFNSGITIGSTSYTGEHTNAAGTTIGNGYMEISASDPFIDFHKSGLYTSDYSSRLIHGSTRDRLYYECYSSTYSGYVATCEGNPNNLTIIGVFDLYKTSDSTTTWSINTICGPCSFSLQQTNSNNDVSFKSKQSYVQSWTISGNVLRVYVNAPSSSTYAWKSTPYAVSCDARVMTRWINNQPVVTNCLHGDWMGSSVECLCTNLSYGSSLSYSSSSPGRYIYITSSRPWGYDDGDNGLGMDMMRQTGNSSYQRIRFTVFGYIS